MKYVALLRAVNVGGRNPVKMSALKDCLEQQKLDSVSTYIQSGNVIFEGGRLSPAALTELIERALSKTFGFEIPIVLQSATQLRTVVDGAPRSWTRGADLRRNVAFLRRPLTATRAIKDVDVREGVDVVTPGKGVLYMSTEMSALGSSRLTKLVTKKIYAEMTIRSYNTCQKILALMA
jgi:uncharacterized protein (DUF1697 family)